MDKITIIHETKDFIAVNKPAYLLVHPVRDKPPQGGCRPVSNQSRIQYTKYKLQDTSLVSWLLKNRPETKEVGDNPEIRPGLVHRLDKETSGILVVAKNNHFFQYFKSLLQKRLVQKTYYALVYGKLDKKITINKPIGLIHGTTKRSTKAKNMKMLKDAITEIEPVKCFNFQNQSLTLVKVFPKTGRTHQIRVHLTSIGMPIVGDKLYGPKKNPLNLNRHFLHAASLEFSTEDGKRIKLETELPEELRSVIKSLSQSAQT